jgi:cholesterol transport system auxiliary component
MSAPRMDRRALLAIMLAGGLAGCGTTLTKPFPEKRQFVLTAARPRKEARPQNGLVLLVRRFTIDPAFQERSIVTRSDAVSVQSDFYNEFFIEPAQLVNGQVTGWLAASGLFDDVVGPASALTPTHVLEGFVAKLYGDLSHAATAVMELQLLVLDVRNGGNRILVHPDLERDSPAASSEPSALVAAWNTDLGQILTEFEQGLRQAMR